ncbi:3-methyl-2-oxobutanoate hydroxymethyltransferase [Kineococcus radiotolerans]|uniref:3-methyl-2-oxobutanoate hydroxymethyltransferase n=1 Tax=Kineococcus radiotolerans (strain ATCC BAA-149 / DSM 14245 / SRS30216) TaxID=266940 RepID=A6WD73_KINRD|nr:3-methyl-2-oxobutanoate hydroxymethyltransferase [Kineococcus radiotolerans]ABS04762.1 3-methyl-2-oxobutanoate hydroxymethyltransferase [Kineococcus radiotolerans SRS30216 = ATCC BAA-149]
MTYATEPPPPVPGRRRTRVHHFQQWKDAGEKWAMLTSYDAMTAAVFDEAGIPALLVGDSAANTVFGMPTTLPVTLDHLLPLVRAVVAGAPHAFVVADLPFGSYEVSDDLAVASAVRVMKEGGAHAVKFEGGARRAGRVRAVVEAGIPVMAHIGFTPQSEHALGGYRVQGRGEAGEQVLADARALAEAGAFAVLMEMVPADVAAQVTRTLAVPTVGIGAGSGTDGQVLVWQDFAGLSERTAKFVKRFADVRTALSDAARQYAEEVRGGSFPGPEHSF